MVVEGAAEVERVVVVLPPCFGLGVLVIGWLVHGGPETQGVVVRFGPGIVEVVESVRPWWVGGWGGRLGR